MWGLPNENLKPAEDSVGFLLLSQTVVKTSILFNGVTKFSKKWQVKTTVAGGDQLFKWRTLLFAKDPFILVDQLIQF